MVELECRVQGMEGQVQGKCQEMGARVDEVRGRLEAVGAKVQGKFPHVVKPPVCSWSHGLNSYELEASLSALSARFEQKLQVLRACGRSGTSGRQP